MLNSETGIPEKYNMQKSKMNGQFSVPGVNLVQRVFMNYNHSNSRSRDSYLMVVMQPPRRIKLGCSVKQTILESGDRLSSSLVNKSERPRGSYCNKWSDGIKHQYNSM